jgi:hypothetical protein
MLAGPERNRSGHSGIRAAVDVGEEDELAVNTAVGGVPGDSDRRTPTDGLRPPKRESGHVLIEWAWRKAFSPGALSPLCVPECLRGTICRRRRSLCGRAIGMLCWVLITKRQKRALLCADGSSRPRALQGNEAFFC